MEREFGAKDACEFVRRCDFTPSAIKFDAAMNKTKEKKTETVHLKFVFARLSSGTARFPA